VTRTWLEKLRIFRCGRLQQQHGVHRVVVVCACLGVTPR
jgi:hypothetical protein